MKLSQFRQVIKEEVRKTLKEAYNLPTQATPEEFQQAVNDILLDLKKQIDKAAASVKVVYIDNDNPNRQYSVGNELMVKYEGIKQANKLVSAYNDILYYLDSYTKAREPRIQKSDENSIRSILAKL